MNKDKGPSIIAATPAHNEENNEMSKDLHKPEVAVVIPTLNEEEAIGVVIDAIEEAMREYNYQIVVVDGNSTDRTVEIARLNGVPVLYQREVGYGDALRTGFEYACKELKAPITVMMDGDGTYDPKDIPRLVQPLIKTEADLVIGNRFKGMEKGAMSLTNRVGNRILSWMARKILGIKIHDTQCGLRAFRTEMIEGLDLRARGMPFAIEMLAEARQARAKISEVPVTYRRRIGETKLNPVRDGLRILSVILRLTRDHQPLLFFGGPGMIFVLAGTLLGMRAVIEWLTVKSITHLASVVLSALLIMTGIQLFSLGLIADMIKNNKRRTQRG